MGPPGITNRNGWRLGGLVGLRCISQSFVLGFNGFLSFGFYFCHLFSLVHKPPSSLIFPVQINSAYPFPRTLAQKEAIPDHTQQPNMAGAKKDAAKGDNLAVPPARGESESKAPTIAESEDARGYNNKEVLSDTDGGRTIDSTDPEKERPHTLSQQKSNATHKSHASTIREDGVEYPTGLKLGLITIALCLSVFLMALGEFSSLVLVLERKRERLTSRR